MAVRQALPFSSHAFHRLLTKTTITEQRLHYRAEDLSNVKGRIVLGDQVNGITFNYGTFEVDVVTGVSNSPGSSTRGQLDIVSVFLRNTGPSTATLRISMSDDGFNSPDPPLIINSLFSGALNEGTGSVSFTSYADDSGLLFGTDFATGTLSQNLNATLSPAGFNLANSRDGFVFSGTYSMTNIAEYTLSAGALLNVSSGKSTLVTPVPPTLVVMLGGLPLLGLALRRRRNGRPA